MIVSGLFLASFILFALKKRRESKQKQRERQQNKRRPGETPYRISQRTAFIVPMYQPAHFDGRRHRVENALKREAIRACLTRNDTWAVEKPKEE